MKTKVIYGFAGILLIVIAVGISGFLIKSKPEPKKDNRKHSIIYVKAQEVKLTDTDAKITYRGRVTAFDNISLAAEVSGKIMQGDVRFKTGESFEKDDVLVKIYSEDIEAALKSGKSSFLQTLSLILPDLRVDYSQEYDKWNDFFNSIDPAKPLPRLPHINSDKEKVFMASNNVLASYYSLQQKEINLKRYTIVAPFKGSFKVVNKEIGAVASPGAELAKIIRSDKLEVVVPVFPSDLKWIKKGDRVHINDNTKKDQSAVVSRISGFIKDQSVNVYLTYLSTGGDSFLEGGYVDAVFEGSKVVGFEVPREAIVDKSFVWELINGTLKKTEVDIKCQLDDTVIISGIAISKVIVTESMASVNPNMEYQARPQ